MVPPEELEKAQPTTLPADFGEWDSGEDSAKHPANFNGFESFPASAPAPKPPVKSATARVAVLPVAGRSSSAASRPSAAAYAEVEQAYPAPKPKAVKAVAPAQRAESAGSKGQTGMFIGIGAAALLLIGGTVGYFKMHSKTVAPNTTVVTQTQAANSGTQAANSGTPVPSTQAVANTPAQGNAPTAAETAPAAETDSALRAQSEKMNKQLNAPSLIREDLRTLAGGAAPPTSGFGTAGMEGVANTGGVFNAEGGPKVKVAAPQKVSISGTMAVGMLVQRTQPAYPPLAKQAHVSGTVMIQATVSKTGSVVNPKVVSGPPLLQQAALDAVKTWRFKPYMLDGEPTEVETTVNVTFALPY
jgi:periplasmic protein TonB